MVSFFELIPEIVPILALIGLIAITRLFLEPIADKEHIIDKSEFKSLRQELYDKKQEVTFTDS